jgi:SPP1 gp7 family putative phage head morphogenesis protein
MTPVLPVGLPPQEAIAYFQNKGYRFSFSWLDVERAEHAKAFTVAKVMRADILRDLQEAVDRSIAEGTSLADFRRALTPLLQRKGWWGMQRLIDPSDGKEKVVQLGSPRRLETIYDTNLRTSYAAGRWEQIQRTKTRRPYLRYVAILDARTRPQHRAWSGLVLPADDPFWLTHFPPNGWRCRCAVQQLSDRDLVRYGYAVSDSPVVDLVAYRNARTGEVRQVPAGIDPGFDYNAGVAGLARLRELADSRGAA